MTTADVRREIIQYLQREVIGPAPGFPAVQLNGEEILRSQDPPRLRYSAGILFPTRSDLKPPDFTEKEMEGAESGPAEQSDGDRILDGAELTDSPNPVDQQPETDLDLNLANQYLPSAMGISTLVELPKLLIVTVEAARYIKTELRGFGRSKARAEVNTTPYAWFRKPFTATVTFDKSELLDRRIISLEKTVKIEGVDSKLAVYVVSRPQKRGHADERLISFTLINRNESDRTSNDELCFFQCRLAIESADSSDCFLEYPEQEYSDDAEEHTMRFLYRNRRVFAVGHGCSCDWRETTPGRSSRIWTEVLPLYEIRPIEHVDVPGVSFLMERLAAGGSEALDLCEKLASAYRQWIADQRDRLANPIDVPPDFLDAASANLDVCEKCVQRINVGIDTLRRDRVVQRAFTLANRAMYFQQAHYDLASNKVRKWVWKDRALQLQERYKVPDYSAKAAAWRPFQLAFLLMNLEPIANPKSELRNVVDLIWFPTGGGKTEAYLGLSAFTILLRRLRNQADAGTTVLMRYTLRLLTAQQFQRAASLICACEYIRRAESDALGSKAISIGLWVGGSVTPNDCQDAVLALNRLHQSPTENKFIVLACPWCGAAMGPARAGDHWKVKGYIKTGRPACVAFRCEDTDCPFSSGDGLPLTVVDEIIYKTPPTLVIGTVDKFAMLPWKPEAKSLFGLTHGYSSPELIVQDELHLISGPLGSMIAHYETAIEALCRATDNEIPPKIVASTATIARANEQVSAIYNGRSAFLFPPQGLEVGDSFFAKENTSKPGRCYLGVFGSALPSHVTSQIRTVSALLQSVKSLPVKDPRLIDPFWTLMVYFNSIRELGHAATLIRADIREHMNAMWDRQGLTKDVSAESPKERRFINRDLELTSRVQSNRIPEILGELFNSLGPVQDYSVVDVCLATNMIQVGLDVPRLSLMAIIGQPKTTAEYIQASSRVGRRDPGLVVTIYNPARPRDRSHYEHFRAYHQSIYRFVEPTSVTPFARPVIERALHAVIVALVRMLGDDRVSARPDSPPPGDELLQRVRGIIADRVTNVDMEQRAAALARVDYIISEWKRVPPSKYGGFAPPDPEEPLLYPSGSERHPRWSIRPLSTPTSMRNVDATCDTQVLSSFPEAD